MTPPNAGRTARERARAELTREIKEEARRQLVTSGADGLSLRAVARELGMVSSALYRYFPSRDDLLTGLIIDAYDAIGAAVEEAIAAVPPAGASTGAVLGESVRGRWVAACRAVRSWARAHPHEYALIYGSPVPGYRAPEATIGPASRVPLALVGVLREAVASGLLASTGPETLPGPLAEQAAAVAAALAAADGETGPAVPEDVLVRCVMAWTQLFGMVSFELFGQFVNSFEPTDALFEYAVDQMAAYVVGRSEGNFGIAARSLAPDEYLKPPRPYSVLALPDVYSDAEIGPDLRPCPDPGLCDRQAAPCGRCPPAGLFRFPISPRPRRARISCGQVPR